MALKDRNFQIGAALYKAGARCSAKESQNSVYHDFISYLQKTGQLACPPSGVLTTPPAQSLQHPLIEQLTLLNKQYQLDLQQKDLRIEKQREIILRLTQQLDEHKLLIQQLRDPQKGNPSGFQQDKEFILMKNREQIQIKIWERMKRKAERITSFESLTFIEKLGNGCDGVVFRCSAHSVGLEPVAVKILFNFGLSTNTMVTSNENEFELLNNLPLHLNVIPILHYFSAPPPLAFINEFPPDLKAIVVNVPSSQPRTTLCIMMPIMDSFECYFQREFPHLTVLEKFAFIADIIDALQYLSEHNIVHRDLKLNNILIHPSGRLIISDFGHAAKVSCDKKLYLSPGDSIGGNLSHLAPEVKVNPNIPPSPVLVDYTKQPSYELGVLAFEIFFNSLPATNCEKINDLYWAELISQSNLDSTHNLPRFFAWLRSLLEPLPVNRADFSFSASLFRDIRTNIQYS